MKEELISQLLTELKNEKIRFGTCEIKLTFHEGKIKYYEICSNRRVNITEQHTTNRGEK